MKLSATHLRLCKLPLVTVHILFLSPVSSLFPSRKIEIDILLSEIIRKIEIKYLN